MYVSRLVSAQRSADSRYRFRGPTIDPEHGDPIEAQICVYRLVDCVAGVVETDVAGVRIDPDPPTGLDLQVPPAFVPLP